MEYIGRHRAPETDDSLEGVPAETIRSAELTEIANSQ